MSQDIVKKNNLLNQRIVIGRATSAPDRSSRTFASPLHQFAEQERIDSNLPVSHFMEHNPPWG